MKSAIRSSAGGVTAGREDSWAFYLMEFHRPVHNLSFKRLPKTLFRFALP